MNTSSREFLGKYFLEIHQFLLKNCSYWNRIAHPIASSKLRGQGMMNYKWDYKRLKLGSLAVSLFEMIMRWICAAKTSTPVHTQEDTKTNSNKVPCMQKNTRLHNILAEWFHICLLTAFGSFLPQQLSMTQRVFVGSNQLQRGDYSKQELSKMGERPRWERKKVGRKPDWKFWVMGK